MANYSVKKLATMAGVSVRTLHLYDQMGLLKPSVRTEAGYRLYGEKERLRLQQILFYKELDFSLQHIRQLLNSPDFDLFHALESHKEALRRRAERISRLLVTIDKTMLQLKGKIMLQPEELYDGFPKEQAEAYRKEAVDKYGNDEVERSEKHLQKMGKEGFERLKEEQHAIAERLHRLMPQDPQSAAVQAEIANHYANIRQFWGTAGFADPQAEAYAGLGQLYVSDERFTAVNGQSDPAYALFLSKAMAYFADTALKKR